MSLDPSAFATLLCAGAVRSIGIVHRRESWEVWVRVGQTLAESAPEPIHATPGELRHWSSFDAAYAFVRGQGYRGTVEVDDAAESADAPAIAAQAAAPEPPPPTKEVVAAAAAPQTPQAKGKKNARSPLALTTPPMKSTTTPSRTTVSRPRPLSGPHRSTRPGTRPTPKDPQG